MKLIYITTAMVLILVILIPIVLSLMIRKVPSGYQPSLSNSQSVDQNNFIKQTFLVQNDGLSGLGLSIKNPYFRNKQDLIFNLYDNQNLLLRTVTLNGKNIADGNFLIINFDPITNSKGQGFSFTLTAPGVDSNQSLEVYHSDSQAKSEEIYLVNNQTKDGKVSFVYYWTPKNPLVNLIIIYRNFLSRFFQDLPFASFYLLVLVGLIAMSVRGIKRIN